jgi:hypothetical protein
MMQYNRAAGSAAGAAAAAGTSDGILPVTLK